MAQCCPCGSPLRSIANENIWVTPGCLQDLYLKGVVVSCAWCAENHKQHFCQNSCAGTSRWTKGARPRSWRCPLHLNGRSWPSTTSIARPPSTTPIARPPSTIPVARPRPPVQAIVLPDVIEEEPAREILCPVCYVNLPTQAYVPCGHVVCDCCLRHDSVNAKCVTCRQVHTSILNLHL